MLYLAISLVLSSLAFGERLVLKQSPKSVIRANYCLSSLISEPETGCISWNRNETAGPLYDSEQGKVYVGGSDQQLHVLSDVSLKKIKTLSLPGKLNSQAILASNSLLLGTNQGHVLSLNRDTLEQSWQQKLDAEIPNSLVYSNDRLYAVTGLGTLVALESDSGNVVWEQKRPLGSNLGLNAFSNPLILENKIVIGNASGKVEFFRTDDGVLLFDINIADNKKSFPNVATTPVLINNNLIAAASFNQGIAVFDNTGVISWTLALPGVTQLLAADSLLIAAGPKQVTAIDISTHQIKWRFSFLKGSPNKLISKNGLLYSASDRDGLYVLDLKTGKPQQILGSGLGFAGNFDFSSDSTLFAFSTAGYLYAYGRKNNSSCCGFN